MLTLSMIMKEDTRVDTERVYVGKDDACVDTERAYVGETDTSSGKALG